ncbi:SLC13 family permease [Halorientalis salina]|uniref:SLC13 family permease n=1 Tax=Halorientalis salina TaxID=2932266 RepID=UPI002022B42A|nr:SLC13 family permease [Halorientalis salina]
MVSVGVSMGMLVVFGLIFVALLLFVTELIPSDITAIGILVSLVVLEPYTGVTARDAISGFASPATVTIIAMYILSEGIQQTGIVERLGVYLARITNGDESRLLAATVGTTGVSAGIINNTPVVAVFIPMISGLAERARISPSKLLLPMSYAAMMGGTLTLIGTSTNILASDLSRELLDHPISMFEFTPLGVLVLLVGAAYLLTVGRWLTPARIDPTADLTEAYELGDHLWRVSIRETSPLVGQRASDVLADLEADEGVDLDVLQIERNGESFVATATDQLVEPGDVFIVRGRRTNADRFASEYDLRTRPVDEVSEADFSEGDGSLLVEAVVLPDSRLVAQTVAEAKLDAQFDTTVLAIRRGGKDPIRSDLEATQIESGDTLLVQTTTEKIEYLADQGTLVPTEGVDEELLEPDAEPENIAPLSSKTPIAVGTMITVIGLAALGVLPIVIAALGGVFAMVVTGCLTASDAYDAVSWNIVFLLAGVLPLGVAMQQSGGAEFIAGVLVASADILPVVAVLLLFYLLTGLLANIITPVASVVLMIPVAVDTASRIGADGFSFLLAVTFAGSAAFMTPIGYQTNLMVYGPGGYKFTDYLRVGAPLQLLLSVVTTLGIVALFGV